MHSQMALRPTCYQSSVVAIGDYRTIFGRAGISVYLHLFRYKCTLWHRRRQELPDFVCFKAIIVFNTNVNWLASTMKFTVSDREIRNFHACSRVWDLRQTSVFKVLSSLSIALSTWIGSFQCSVLKDSVYLFDGCYHRRTARIERTFNCEYLLGQ
jgi:hypothetical protein